MKKLGKYEIIKELGRGAMGVVYLASDPTIGRKVALKTITAGLAENPELLERFNREARAAGQLQHLNIVTIFELGEENKMPFIAMELLDGNSLEHLISEKREIPLVEKVGYFVQVCRGLAYAHENGVVHRDIKPANIQLTSKNVIKILDFGIARVMAASKTQTGMMMGTVAYMSPEQVRGDHVDGRSDIWSVGVTFQEFMSGVRPFTADNIAAVMFNIVTQEPKPLSSLVPDAPPELDAVMMRIFKKQAADRYQTLDDVLLDLEPVHKKLQQSGVVQIVTQSKQLLESGEFQRAHDMLRSALRIDAANREVRMLLERASEELKRTGVLPELSERCAKAESLLKEGKVAEATEQAEAALRLDSKYGPALEILQKVRAQADREKAISQMMATAIQQRDQGNLTGAEQQLENLETVYGEIPQAAELKKKIAEERKERDRRKRLSAEVGRARGLWTDQKYKECVDLLVELQKEFPSEAEVQNLLDTARADLEEQLRRERQQERDRKVAEARKMLGEQKFAEALGLLEPLLQADPNDSVAQRLRDRVLVERKEHAKRIRVQHEQQAVKKLINEGKAQEAATRAEALLQEFPDELDVKQLVEFAHAQLAKEQQKRQLEEQIQAVRDLLEDRDFDKALAAAEKAAAANPGNKEIEKLLREVQGKIKERKEQQEREFIAVQLRKMSEAIEKDELTAAIDLGNKTIVAAGQNAEVTRLMQLAQQKQKERGPKPDTEQQLKTAYYKWTEGKLEEADQILADAQKTQIFDPRVHEMREKIKGKQPPPPAQTVFGQIGFGVPTTQETPPATTPPPDAAKTVFRTMDSVPAIPVQDGTTVMPRGAMPPGVLPPPAPPAEKEKEKEPAQAAAPPAPPVVEPKKPEKEKDKKKKSKEPEVTKEQFDSTVKIFEPPKAKAPAAEPPAPAKEEKKPAAAPPAAPPPVKEEKKAAAPPPVAPPVEKPKPKEEKKAAPAPAPVAPREEPIEVRPKKAAEAAEMPAQLVAPKKSNMPMIAGGVGALVVVSVVLYFVLGKKPDTTPPQVTDQPGVTQPSGGGGTQPGPVAGSGGTTPDTTPRGPVVTEEEKRQRALLTKAQKAYSKGDSKGAYKALDDAAKISGPLGKEIAKQRESFDIAEKDTARKALLQKESSLMSQAGEAAARRDDVNSQRQAADLYRQAADLNGDNKQSALEGQKNAEQRASDLGLIPGLRSEVTEALGREDYGTARQKAQQIGRIVESEGRTQVARVDSAENGKAALLQSQFDRAVRNKSTSELDQLNNDIQRYKGGSGPLAAKARDLESRIPGEKTKIAEANKPTPPPDERPVPPPPQRTYRAAFNPLSYQPYTEAGLRDGDRVLNRHVDGGLKLLSHDLPQDLLRRTTQGSTLTIEFDVGSDGRVTGGTVQGADPAGVGRDIIEAATASWKFSEPRVQGKRVITRARVVLTFN